MRYSYFWHQKRLRACNAAFVFLLTAFVSQAAPRRESRPADPAEDTISVIGHLPLSGDSAQRLLTGVHWRRNYLYVELANRRAILTVDVTRPAEPKIASEFPLAAQAPDTHIASVVGQAVLVAGAGDVRTAQRLGTVRVLSFADPAHPKLIREFTHVSAMVKDESRGLTYLVDSGGLWVLLDRPARDLELERQYDHDVGQNQ